MQTATLDPTSNEHARAEDTALLQRLRAGEAGAYEDLLRRYGGRLLAVARRMMPTEDDAEDALQDAMLSAFKALGSFDGQSQLSTWLHRIVVNACLMKLRSKRRRPERSIDDLLPKFGDDGHVLDPVRPWADEGPSDDLKATIRASLDELPEAYRVVLVLRDVQGMDTIETAAVLGLSPNAVKTRLHRARQALRTLLDPHLRREPS